MNALDQLSETTPVVIHADVTVGVLPLHDNVQYLIGLEPSNNIVASAEMQIATCEEMTLVLL